MSSAVYLWKTFREQAEQHSGVGQKVFGFVPESVFSFSPEWCSESARNPVRLHPGTLFGLPRNTHLSATFTACDFHSIGRPCLMSPSILEPSGNFHTLRLTSEMHLQGASHTGDCRFSG